VNPTEELVTAVVAIADLTTDQYIVMATRRGEIKRMQLSQFANIRSNGLAAFDLNKGDSLLTARLADPGTSTIIISKNGKAVHFSLDDVRVRQTRGAGGVRGIRLLGDDEVVGMDVATEGAQLLILTARGYGKRTIVDHFRKTGRGVQGVISLKISDKTGDIAAAVITGPEVEEVMVGSAKAMVYRTAIKEIRTLGRNTQGVQVMTKLGSADRVISMSAFKERAFDEDLEPDPTPVPRATRGRINGTAKKADDAPEESTDQVEGDAPEADEDDNAPQGQGAFDFPDVGTVVDDGNNNDGNDDANANDNDEDDDAAEAEADDDE